MNIERHKQRKILTSNAKCLNKMIFIFNSIPSSLKMSIKPTDIVSVFDKHSRQDIISELFILNQNKQTKHKPEFITIFLTF